MSSLNPQAVAAADQAFYAKYPERNGKPLTPGEPGFDQLAKEWLDLYQEAAAKPANPSPAAPPADGQPGPPIAQTKVDCPGGGPADLPKDPPTPPQKLEPCDFEEVSIKCSHCGGENRSLPELKLWRNEGGVLLNNLPPLPANSKRIRFPNVLEVIAADESQQQVSFFGHKMQTGTTSVEMFGHAAGSSDKITIELRKGPGYCQEFKHPGIQVWDSHRQTWVKGSPTKGKTSFEFDAYPKLPTIPLPILAGGKALSVIQLMYYLLLDHFRIREYEIHLDACPTRPDKQYQRSLAGTCLSVRVFPSDKFTLSIEMSPRFQRKREIQSTTQKQQGVQSNVFSTTDTTKVGSTTTTNQNTLEYNADKIGYSEKQTQTDKSGESSSEMSFDSDGNFSLSVEKKAAEGGKLSFLKKAFKLKRNDQDLYKPDTDSIVDTAIGYIVKFQELIELIRNAGPMKLNVGFWYDLNFSALSGEVTCTWQNKERNDNTVFKSVELSGNLTLFEGSVTVNYGCELSFKKNKKKDAEGEEKAGAKVFGSFSGKAAVGLNGKITADDIVSEDDVAKKDKHGKPAGEGTGTIGLQLGVSATAPGEILNLEAAGAAELKVTGAAYIHPQNGFGIHWTMTRDDVKVTFKLAILWKIIHLKKEWVVYPKSKEPEDWGWWPNNSPKATEEDLKVDPITKETLA